MANNEFFSKKEQGINIAEQINSKLGKLDESVENILKILPVIDGSGENHIPKCSPDPKCFALLLSAYTIGAWLSSIRTGYSTSACNGYLKNYCMSNEYQDCMEILCGNQELQNLYKDLLAQWKSKSYTEVCNRINNLNTFIYLAILWCQASQDED